MKRKLYVDGNTVYGIDEECLIRKRQEAGSMNRRDLDALWERYQEEVEGSMKGSATREQFRQY